MLPGQVYEPGWTELFLCHVFLSICSDIFYRVQFPLRKMTDASLKAHRRWALPIFLPTAVFFAIGFLGAFDQAGVGGKILYPGEAVDIFYFIEQVERNDPAYSGNGFEQGIGPGVMNIGALDNVPLKHGDNLVVGLDHVEVGGRHSSGRMIRRNARPGLPCSPVWRCGRAAPEIVLACGVLGMGKSSARLRMK